MIASEVGQEDIGLWFFTVKDDEKLIHMEVEFRTQAAAQEAHDTWLRESDGSKRVKDGILEETRETYYLTDEGHPYAPHLIKWRENLTTGQTWWRHLDKADWEETAYIE